MDKQTVHELVQTRYGQAALEVEGGDEAGCCGPGVAAASCCDSAGSSAQLVELLGYENEALEAIPETANLGLGCGNPGAIAALKAGETVLDLGSGAGIDCFLAANQVGPAGRVIGVDMTSQMLELARANAAKGDYTNVEFRRGQIEKLPVADSEVDVIMSNCVINLSPDKRAVYNEAYRVLKPGGRLAISDIVATAELPEEVRSDERLLTGCVAGAETIANQMAWLAEAGFQQIKIQPKDTSAQLLDHWVPGSKLEDFVVSATIEAVKPLE